MNLRSLEYFVALAEELNFTRAASRCNIEQAALSQAIRRLEDEVGVKLFDRSTRGVALTQGGEAFLPTAVSALDLLTSGLRDARSIQSGKKGVLRIGYVAAAAFDVIPNLLRSFRVEFPEIEFDLRQIDSEEQLELLARGDVDGGFIRPRLLPPEYSVSPVTREPFVCVLPASHALACRASVSVEELEHEEFVMLPTEPPTNFSAVIASIFEGAGFSPRIAQHTRLFTTIVGLVGAGLGISIVPSSVRKMDISGVKFVALDGVNKTAGLDFVCRSDNTSPLLRRLISKVQHQFEDDDLSARRKDDMTMPTTSSNILT